MSGSPDTPHFFLNTDGTPQRMLSAFEALGITESDDLGGFPGLLSDTEIRARCQDSRVIRVAVRGRAGAAITQDVVSAQTPMISPFFDYDHVRPEGTLSYGLSSAGYDLVAGDEFWVFKNTRPGAIIDPKAFDMERCCDVVRAPEDVLIPPHSFALCHSRETFCIPRDILVTCLGKSTYARCGIIVNVTPLEPEWPGVLTIELSNTTPLPVRVYPGEGLCQLLFHKIAGRVERSYADKRGKYMNQTGVTAPRAS